MSRPNYSIHLATAWFVIAATLVAGALSWSAAILLIPALIAAVTGARAATRTRLLEPEQVDVDRADAMLRSLSGDLKYKVVLRPRRDLAVMVRSRTSTIVVNSSFAAGASDSELRGALATGIGLSRTALMQSRILATSVAAPLCLVAVEMLWLPTIHDAIPSDAELHLWWACWIASSAVIWASAVVAVTELLCARSSVKRLKMSDEVALALLDHPEDLTNGLTAMKRSDDLLPWIARMPWPSVRPPSMLDQRIRSNRAVSTQLVAATRMNPNEIAPMPQLARNDSASARAKAVALQAVFPWSFVSIVLILAGIEVSPGLYLAAALGFILSLNTAVRIGTTDMTAAIYFDKFLVSAIGRDEVGVMVADRYTAPCFASRLGSNRQVCASTRFVRSASPSELRGAAAIMHADFRTKAAAKWMTPLGFAIASLPGVLVPLIFFRSASGDGVGLFLGIVPGYCICATYCVQLCSGLSSRLPATRERLFAVDRLAVEIAGSTADIRAALTAMEDWCVTPEFPSTGFQKFACSLAVPFDTRSWYRERVSSLANPKNEIDTAMVSGAIAS